jgi:hypothetical protein
MLQQPVLKTPAYLTRNQDTMQDTDQESWVENLDDSFLYLCALWAPSVSVAFLQRGCLRFTGNFGVYVLPLGGDFADHR